MDRHEDREAAKWVEKYVWGIDLALRMDLPMYVVPPAWLHAPALRELKRRYPQAEVRETKSVVEIAPARNAPAVVDNLRENQT